MKSYSFLVFIGMMVFVSSCETSSEKSQVLSSGLYLEYMDTTVSPGDNFHSYVNGEWIKNTPIPDDKSSYGIFYMLHEESQENVKAIIEESASGDFAEGSDEQKVGDLYASYMDTIRREELGIEPMKAEFEKIDALVSHEDLDTYFAEAGTYGRNIPLGMSVFPDFKDPQKYSLYVFQGGLGLPDREYYLKEEGDFPKYREEYQNHMAKMFTLSGIEDGESIAKTVMDLETAMAKLHWTKEVNRDWSKLYNVFPVDSMDALMPSFDWPAFMKDSYADVIESFVMAQPSFAFGLEDLYQQFDLTAWKWYLKWVVIDDSAGKLNKALDDQNFAFYATTLRGVPSQRPRWRRAVNVVNQHLGEVVGKVYVSRHFPPEAKSRMMALVNNLLGAYEESINTLTWMGDSTKIQALDKLSKFTTKIGYPDEWKDYSEVKISADHLFNNMKYANLAEHKRQLAKLGAPIDKNEWFMNPQTINAYYNPTKNEIAFPAGILQPPFFDMNADDAVNYGAIGAVIGHEIGHGFDDKGSTFDGDGVMRDWWTEQDRAEFEKRTAKLIEQYNGYEVLDSVFVNGEFTQGENIGDLGGLTIALKAYQMSLDGKEAPVIDGRTGIQRLFLGYAQAWRSKSRDEALKVQVNTDPHSPAVFRVNGIVRNVPEFYEAFDIQEGDSLYLSPEERVEIW